VTGNATTPPYFARNSSGFIAAQNLLLLFPIIYFTIHMKSRHFIEACA
jgi:hypothetical protein